MIQYQNKLRLLEIAQVPKENVDEFKSVSKFRIFNTNNLWVNLPAIKRVIEEKTLHMEIIVNHKVEKTKIFSFRFSSIRFFSIDRHWKKESMLFNWKRPVVQRFKVLKELKVNIFFSIFLFLDDFSFSLGINVPRRRFLPVKTTSDLLLVMSNLFTLNRGNLVMNAQRSFPSVPLVKLGTSFTKVKDFLSRFQSIPDCLELDSLTVSGDVTFGKGVSLRVSRTERWKKTRKFSIRHAF